jgi:hypothetical protein
LATGEARSFEDAAKASGALRTVGVGTVSGCLEGAVR